MPNDNLSLIPKSQIASERQDTMARITEQCKGRLSIRPLENFLSSFPEMVGIGAFGTIHAHTRDITGSNPAYKVISFDIHDDLDDEYFLSELKVLQTLTQSHHSWGPPASEEDKHWTLLLKNNNLIQSIAFYVGPVSFPVYDILSHQGAATFNRLLQSHDHTIYSFFASLRKGLIFLHNTVHVNHGDIKPEQILLDPSSGKPKLCDFGSSSFFCKKIFRIASTEYFRTPSLQNHTNQTNTQIEVPNRDPQQTQNLLINEDNWALMLTFIIFKRLTMYSGNIVIRPRSHYAGIFDRSSISLNMNCASSIGHGKSLQNLMLFYLYLLDMRAKNTLNILFFSTSLRQKSRDQKDDNTLCLKKDLPISPFNWDSFSSDVRRYSASNSLFNDPIYCLVQ